MCFPFLFFEFVEHAHVCIQFEQTRSAEIFPAWKIGIKAGRFIGGELAVVGETARVKIFVQDPHLSANRKIVRSGNFIGNFALRQTRRPRNPLRHQITPPGKLFRATSIYHHFYVTDGEILKLPSG